MVTLVIPTRNRPQSLGQVLTFLGEFYRGTNVVVADGSTEGYEDEYRTVIAAAEPKTPVDYKVYNSDMPFLDRVHDVLDGLGDECIAMGADDDFPNMTLFKKAESFLLDNPDYVTAMAGSVNFNLKPDGELTSRLNLVRDASDDDVVKRIESYCLWPFSTTYATTRRKHLLERYKRFRNLFVPGFYDFSLGLHDCAVGKIKTFDGFGYFCTRNYNHSYIRAAGNSTFLENSAEILRLIDITANDLVALGIKESEARQTANRAYKGRVREHCEVGGEKWTRLTQSRVFKSALTQRRLREFEGLFAPDNAARSAYESKLKFIVNAIRANAVSSDNASEPQLYGSIEMKQTIEV